jgi:hypothetical protein
MSQLIDCIIVSTEPYTVQGRGDRSPEDCYRFCMEVSVYAERASAFGFADHQLPQPLIHVHRATEVPYRSESHDDLGDFFDQIEWSEVTIKETIGALRAIGADEHVRLFVTIDDYLKGLNYKVGESNLKRVRAAVGNAVNEHCPPISCRLAMETSQSTAIPIGAAAGTPFVSRRRDTWTAGQTSRECPTGPIMKLN